MKEKIKLFLDSDILEKYLIGNASQEEVLQAERYIAMYPEVREAYDELQENLETYAKLFAVKAPPDNLREEILKKVRREQVGRKKYYRLAIAASIAVLVSFGASFFFWDQNKSLQEENAIVNNKIDNLEETMRAQLEDVRNQFIVLHNPDTKKVSVKGNKKAKELKAVAYINPVKRLSYINVSKLLIYLRTNVIKCGPR